MDINIVIETLSKRYVIPDDTVRNAIESSEEIKNAATKLAELIIDNKASDKNINEVREMICSHYSRQADNSIVSTLWEPCEDERYCREIGIRSMQCVVEDLMFRLKQANLVPEEYLLTDTESLSQTYLNVVIPNKELGRWHYMIDVDYGGSEGIYLDLYLVIKKKGEEVNHLRLMVGKTLDTDVKAFMRMNFIAAYCNLLLKNDGWAIRGLTEYFNNKEDF